MRTNVGGMKSVRVQGSILRETDKALLLETATVDGDTIQEWLPFSQITAIHRNTDTDQATVWVAEWLVVKKELQTLD